MIWLHAACLVGGVVMVALGCCVEHRYWREHERLPTSVATAVLLGQGMLLAAVGVMGLPYLWGPGAA